MSIIDILNSPWAITQDYLTEIQQVYYTHFRGDKIDLVAFDSPEGDRIRNNDYYQTISGVAVIDISGPLVKRISIFEFFFGGTSFDFIQTAVRLALSDDSVKNILLRIDSPGGTVNGTPETAEIIFESRGIKPIIAFTDGDMTSAAYFIGSAADKVYISSDMTNVGSIGVVSSHFDFSKADADAGIKVTHIYAGKYKTVGNQDEPLSDEHEAVIKSRVDYLYTAFVDAVAIYRGVSIDYVRENMADAKLFIGKQALAPGLVDGVISFDNLINLLADGDSADESIIIDTDINTNLNNKEQKMELTLEKIKADYPEVYKAIFDMGVASVDIEAIKTEATDAGAVAEMQRIKDIEAVSLAGHEALVETLKFDGKTTGNMAAAMIIGAEKVIVEGKKVQLEKDEIEALAQPPAPKVEEDGEKKKKPEIKTENMSVDQITAKCKELYESDSDIRAEFDSLESYVGFEIANAAGQVKILAVPESK